MHLRHLLRVLAHLHDGWRLRIEASRDSDVSAAYWR
jgi:hypothetical protein